MIKYNIRYRGPFEYDKFILNILQLSNEIKIMTRHLKDGDLDLLKTNEELLQKMFDNLTDEDGMLNTILKLKIRN